MNIVPHTLAREVCDEFDSENPHIGQATAVAAAIRARSNEGENDV